MMTPATVRSDRRAAHELKGPRDEIHRMFEEYALTRSHELRERLIILHIGMASRLARRFAGSSENLDDLVQVGYIGLIKAIDRFDPTRGIEFTTYATPTIVGEIKRYFRDKGWHIRIPRYHYDAGRVVDRMVELLTQKLERPPEAGEVADAVAMPLARVLDLSRRAAVRSVMSLDYEAEAGDEQSRARFSEMLGQEDEDIIRLEDRCLIEEVLQAISPRERTILFLRFYQQLSQAQVAAELRISQMHVSRLERAALEKIRGRVVA